MAYFVVSLVLLLWLARSAVNRRRRRFALLASRRDDGVRLPRYVSWRGR
jgi:hypothetical protein